MKTAVSLVVALTVLTAVPPTSTQSDEVRNWVSMSQTKAKVWGRLLAERDLQRALVEFGVMAMKSAKRTNALVDLLDVEQQLQAQYDAVASGVPGTPGEARRRLQKALDSYKSAVRTGYSASWAPLRSQAETDMAVRMVGELRQGMAERCAAGAADINARFDVAKSPGIPPLGHGFMVTYTQGSGLSLQLESDRASAIDPETAKYLQTLKTVLTVLGGIAGQVWFECGPCGSAVGALIGDAIIGLVEGDRRNSATEERAENEAFRYANAATSRDVVREYKRYCGQFASIMDAIGTDLRRTGPERQARLDYARSATFKAKEGTWRTARARLAEADCQVRVAEYFEQGVCKAFGTPISRPTIVADPNCTAADRNACPSVFKIDDIGCRVRSEAVSLLVPDGDKEQVVCSVTPKTNGVETAELREARRIVQASQQRREVDELSLADWKEAAEILSLRVLVASSDEVLVRKEVERGEVALRRAREIALARLVRLVRLAQIEEQSPVLAKPDASEPLRRLRAASAPLMQSAFRFELGAAPPEEFVTRWRRYEEVARNVSLTHAHDPAVASHLLLMSTFGRIMSGVQ